jgi:hypothetical protein
MQRLLTFAIAVVIGALGLDGAEHALLERSMSGLKPPAMHDAVRALAAPPAAPPLFAE